jgi:hypothetical protein
MLTAKMAASSRLQSSYVSGDAIDDVLNDLKRKHPKVDMEVLEKAARILHEKDELRVHFQDNIDEGRAIKTAKTL